MKTKQIIGLIVAAAVFIVTGAASVLTDALSERILGDTAKELFTGGVEFSSPMEDYIAVVRQFQYIVDRPRRSNAYGTARAGNETYIIGDKGFKSRSRDRHRMRPAYFHYVYISDILCGFANR